MRIVSKVKIDNKSIVVKYDNEWSEYIVYFYIDDIEQDGASYHTNTLQDALNTAKYWLTH